MDAIVFYSWQSDLPNATNRGFIQKALENAAKFIARDESIEVEPVIDRDTSGVPGAPDIADTIFKKIERSDVFVCDVSIINQNSGSRPTPNPNVLIELGYALNALGSERVIMVMNTAFGDLSQLPFDLRMRRVMTYHMPKENQDRATERRKLERRIDKELRFIIEKGKSFSASNFPTLDLQFADIEAHIEKGRQLRIEPEITDLPSPSQIPVVRDESVSSFSFNLETLNKSYYREFAFHIKVTNILRPIGFALSNTGSILAVNTRVEIVTPKENGFGFINQYDYPDKPLYYKPKFDANLPPGIFNEKPTVAQRGDKWEISLILGNIQPKATAWSEVFYIACDQQRSIELEALVYADNLPDPLRVPLLISIEPVERSMTLQELLDKADKNR